MAPSNWFRYTTLPPWPGKPTPASQRARSPFKAGKEDTLNLLANEINELIAPPGESRFWHLDLAKTEIAVNVPDHWIRKDGGIIDRYQSHSHNGPEVIVSFNTHASGRLRFPCDTYLHHAANLRAIALTLEKLRAIDRYGAVQGRQYTGFKALPSFTTAVMSTQQAAEAIEKRSGLDALKIMTRPEVARDAIRAAFAKAHPDAGGSTSDFQLVGEAKRILAAHHGSTL